MKKNIVRAISIPFFVYAFWLWWSFDGYISILETAIPLLNFGGVINQVLNWGLVCIFAGIGYAFWIYADKKPEPTPLVANIPLTPEERDEGHEITLEALRELSDEEIEAEIEKCNQGIDEILDGMTDEDLGNLNHETKLLMVQNAWHNLEKEVEKLAENDGYTEAEYQEQHAAADKVIKEELLKRIEKVVEERGKR